MNLDSVEPFADTPGGGLGNVTYLNGNSRLVAEGGTSAPAGLFVSLLVRYPELGSVKFIPETRTLVLTFLLRPSPDSSLFKAFSKRLYQSLEAYSYLSGSPVHVINVSRTDHESCTVIEATRDIDTLTQEELSLIVALVREWFSDRLVPEAAEPMTEEDIQVQDEIIGHMLEDMRKSSSLGDLIGFREGDRVLLFNRGEAKR